MPGARCARSRAWCVVNTRVSHRRPPEHPAFPHAMVLTVCFVLSPVIGLCCHRHLVELPPQNLTPASRRQDHTTSPSAASALVFSAACVHRIPPRVRDDRDTPLEWGRTGRVLKVIWVRREAKYFCKWGWTAQITLIRFSKFPCARKRRSPREPTGRRQKRQAPHRIRNLEIPDSRRTCPGMPVSAS
jgi:hypothetical protein